MINHRESISANPIELDLPPAAVASGLLHLPGLVFLDSSSAEKIGSQQDSNIAIIAARPEQLISGNIHQPGSRAILQTALEQNQHQGMDLGFPIGGLVGWIEYEGEFLFGVYPEMMIFDYSSQQWFEVGNLSQEIASDAPSTIATEFQGVDDFTDSSSRAEFCQAVERAQEYIASGDIYQVNLSHRFSTEWQASSRQMFSLYSKLRHVSPAPYSGYLNLGERTVLSSSPEQFLRISDRTIQTRPIKGTRPRFPDTERDEKSAYDLITSAKEISELVMITDLERNDLGQICEFGSVETTELLKLERFAQVFHLISTVQGRLRAGINHVEAIAACFPGGSITGAPKKRAREIIEELEPIPRGLYTGSIGCLGFNGESRFNIAIRTAIAEADQLHFHVGAGIVADSDSLAEWEETLHKAAGLFRAAKKIC